MGLDSQRKTPCGFCFVIYDRREVCGPPLQATGQRTYVESGTMCRLCMVPAAVAPQTCCCRAALPPVLSQLTPVEHQSHRRMRWPR